MTSYALLEKLLVTLIVLAALAFATWRLAGPFGRLRLMSHCERLCAALDLQGLAARIAAARERRAALQSGSPCANCGPATSKAQHREV
jgi:hypothetical protein